MPRQSSAVTNRSHQTMWRRRRRRGHSARREPPSAPRASVYLYKDIKHFFSMSVSLLAS